ncbi:MAG: hypothetical protein WBR28_23215 [Mycobacterium sp.]
MAEAFGSDAIQLAPAGEAHFDPLSVTLLISSALLVSIGRGICDGVQEWSKKKTVTGLDAIGISIARLVKRDAGKAFTVSPSRDELRKQIDESARALETARLKIGEADVDAGQEVIEVSVSATCSTLEEMGLRSTVSVRVGGALRGALSVALSNESPMA